MAREEKRAVGLDFRRSTKLAAFLSGLGVIATLGACQTPGARAPLPVPSAASTAVDPCDQAHKDFMAAALAYQTPAQVGSENPPKSISHDDISGLRADAEAADDSLAALVGTFGTLAACRSDVLATSELRAAHGALDIASGAEKTLRARLAEQQGGRLVPVPAKGAVAAALAAEQPYLATNAGEIYDRSAAGARPIATLRKGQRLTSPALAAATTKTSGWLPIDLNDGSTGYVSLDVVRPLGGRPTAGVTGDAGARVVAIDLITEALPEKIAALQARLAASEAATSGGT